LIIVVGLASLSAATPSLPVLARPLPAAKPHASAGALRLTVTPPQIEVGRDVSLSIRVRDGAGSAVAGTLLSLTGAGQPAVGTAPQGGPGLRVHAGARGTAVLRAGHSGYAPVTLKLQVVPGAPATIAAVKRGISVLAPHARPVPGKVGADLLEQYHAMTARN